MAARVFEVRQKRRRGRRLLVGALMAMMALVLAPKVEALSGLDVVQRASPLSSAIFFGPISGDGR